MLVNILFQFSFLGFIYVVFGGIFKLGFELCQRGK